MNFLWLFLVLPTVLGQAGFGRSYLKASRLCQKWTCINTKLGLSDSLPPKEQSQEVFKRLLPAGPWQDVVSKVVENCYENRTRRFTNTCPGQALLHCVLDQLIDNCPEEYWVKDDACSPVSSLAGLQYMFSQSRYYNLEKNLPKEHRPAWFLHNYFDSKCCNLPVMFNSSVLKECGFQLVVKYYSHGPADKEDPVVNDRKYPSTSTTAPSSNGFTIKKMDLNKVLNTTELPDPLDCCDMTKFIKPEWRSECDFHLAWSPNDRLVISNEGPDFTTTTTTTTVAPEVKDVMLVPHSCDKETCVFRKLGIIDRNGILDVEAYMKMLQNFTALHPAWTKAAARVVTKCIVKPVEREYVEHDCLINKILSCTFDVLTENCPYKSKKPDVCKHGHNEAGCQISSSKFRPKNRREICLLPELIPRDQLSGCGLDALYKAEHIPVVNKQRKHGWFASKFVCKDAATPTTCIMNKMGIMNKYNFMDYFKMKDRIREFTKDEDEWSALLDIYMSAFINIPMYSGYCSSQKKLMNVIDAMLMTCPISKRKNTVQCNKVFAEMIKKTPVDNQNFTKDRLEEILNHYHHVFLPTPVNTKPRWVIPKKHSKTIKEPIYQYGLLNSKDAPPVKVIDLKPKISIVRPLIVKPVYMNPIFAQRPNNDGVLRNNPFWLHDQIAKAHTTFKPVHTVPTLHNNVYATTPLTTPVSTTAQTGTESPI